VRLVFADGRTETFSAGHLNQLFAEQVREQGRLVSGSFDPSSFPGLVRVEASSTADMQSALIPDDCGELAPLTSPPSGPATPPAGPPASEPPASESPAPTPGARPGPGPDEPSVGPPRVVGGPPDEPTPSELPATGTDVPTQLMVSGLLLLLGAGLLRANRPVAPSDPATINGFRPRRQIPTSQRSP
jgi:LPXTG-motif cell wall-anchored protein